MAFESMKNKMFRHSIMEKSTTAKEALGTLRILDDGRKFRYAKAGGTIAGGAGVESPDVVAHHSNMAVVSNVAAGANKLTVTLGGTAVAANEYAGGYVQVYDGAGAGQQLKILSHPAQTNTSGNVTINLEDPVVVALTSATSKVTLVRNKYEAVIACTAAAKMAVGVSPITVAANDYFWVQTGGIACAKAENTVAVYSNAFLGTTGRLYHGPNATNAQQLAAGPIVGYFMQAGAADKWVPVHLTLD